MVAVVVLWWWWQQGMSGWQRGGGKGWQAACVQSLPAWVQHVCLLATLLPTTAGPLPLPPAESQAKAALEAEDMDD